MNKQADQGHHRQHNGGEIVDDNAHPDLQRTDAGHFAEINPGKIPGDPECRIVGLHDNRPEDIGRQGKCCTKYSHSYKITPARKPAIKKDKNDKREQRQQQYDY